MPQPRAGPSRHRKSLNERLSSRDLTTAQIDRPAPRGSTPAGESVRSLLEQFPTRLRRSRRSSTAPGLVAPVHDYGRMAAPTRLTRTATDRPGTTEEKMRGPRSR